MSALIFVGTTFAVAGIIALLLVAAYATACMAVLCWRETCGLWREYRALTAESRSRSGYVDLYDVFESEDR